MKNLHKFFNKADIPWVHLVWEKYYSNGRLPNQTKKGSFWWKDLLKLLDKFKGMASMAVQDGSSCLLWDDGWTGQPLKLEFPELFSFAKKPSISLKSAGSGGPVSRLFNLPLSIEAFEQFQQLETIFHNVQLNADKDVWLYIWGSFIYTSRKAYRHLIGTCDAHPIYSWLRKSSCQHKHKVFFCLLSKDRLSTRNILRRKHFHLPSYNCILCAANAEETLEHLFLRCDLAIACWDLIGVVINDMNDSSQIFEDIRRQLGVPFFMEVMIIICWSIWTLRNDVIFRGIPASSPRGLEIFKFNFRQLLWRAKKKYFPTIVSWLEQLVFAGLL